MARPLEPFSYKRVAEYYSKMRNAEEENNKQKLKEQKRLFLLYLEKRSKSITEFKNRGLYRFFSDREKPSRINEIRESINSRRKRSNDTGYKETDNNIRESADFQRLINIKYEMREYRKRKYIVKRVKEKFGDRFAEKIRKYLLWKLHYKRELEILVKNNRKDILEWFDIKFYEYEKFSYNLKRCVSFFEKKYKQRTKKYNDKIEYIIKRINEEYDLELLDKKYWYFEKKKSKLLKKEREIIERLVVEYERIRYWYKKIVFN